MFLLPFIEQAPLHDAIDFSRNDPGSQITSAGIQVRQVVLPVYVCPTDDNGGLHLRADGWQDPPSHTTVAVANYAASMGASFQQNFGTGCAETFNHLALSPEKNEQDFGGPFNRFGIETTAAQIRAGLSNTIFFGEVRRACSIHVPVAGAAVAFSPLAGGRRATGVTDAEGRFRLTTFRPGDGAVLGEHVASVYEERPAAGPAPAVDSIAGRGLTACRRTGVILHEAAVEEGSP